MLIENDPVEGSDVTSVLEIGVEKNHPEADVGMEWTDELHQNDDTQRITSSGVGKGGPGGGGVGGGASLPRFCGVDIFLTKKLLKLLK